MKKENLIGFDNGFYKVIDFVGSKDHRRIWKCECRCGKIFETKTYEIKSRHTKSCGCSRNKVLRPYRWIKHGLRITENGKVHPLYNVYMDMKTRCYKASSHNYKNYQGKGIKICDEWLNSIKTFYDWAIQNGWKKGLTIDRIDHDGNYEPNNCQFITKGENTKRMLENKRKKSNGTKEKRNRRKNID